MEKNFGIVHWFNKREKRSVGAAQGRRIYIQKSLPQELPVANSRTGELNYRVTKPLQWL